MPKKVRSLNDIQKKRMSKIPQVMAPGQNRARKFRSSSAWSKVRNMYIRDNPLCENIFGDHMTGSVPAKEVNHIRGLVSNYELRADWDNLSALCVKCHHKISWLERQKKPVSYLFKRPLDS